MNKEMRACTLLHKTSLIAAARVIAALAQRRCQVCCNNQTFEYHHGNDTAVVLVDVSALYMYISRQCCVSACVSCCADVLHITPSDVAELRKFFCLPRDGAEQCTANDLCHAITDASLSDM